MSHPKLVEHLDYEVLNELFNLLNVQRPFGDDWRLFAGNLGIVYKDIKLLEKEDSPAGAALEVWLSRDGPKTVSFLNEVLKRMKRFDGVRVLQDHEFTGMF